MSERIKIWNKYSNIDTHVVKFQFIKKIQNYKINKSLLRNNNTIEETNINKELTENKTEKEHKCDGKSSLCSKVILSWKKISFLFIKLLFLKIPDSIKQFYLNPINVEEVYKSINNRVSSNEEEKEEESETSSLPNSNDTSKPNDVEKEIVNILLRLWFNT